MKKLIFPLFALFLGAEVSAQEDFFALTGKDTPNIVFNDFRALDLARGASGETFLTAEAQPRIFSQVQNKTVVEQKTSYNNSQASGMATLALDARNNALMYIPMYASNIYILDQKTKDITLLETNIIKTTPCNLGSHITRMTAGYDGSVYAINNESSQLIKISKVGGKYQAVDLGAIKDDASNGENSLKQIKIGFGGDMIADADNNLYIFSAFGNIFKVNVNNLTGKFMGKIKGLPENYTVNGAAVNVDGNVVIGSAQGGVLYEVNLDDLQAKTMQNNLNLHIYDLASKYFAYDQKLSQSGSNDLVIYPTQVSNDYFNVKLNKTIKGKLNVEVFDLSGVKVLKRQIVENQRNADARIDLNQLKIGVYLVTIADETGNVILNKKIVVNP